MKIYCFLKLTMYNNLFNFVFSIITFYAYIYIYISCGRASNNWYCNYELAIHTRKILWAKENRQPSQDTIVNNKDMDNARYTVDQ